MKLTDKWYVRSCLLIMCICIAFAVCYVSGYSTNNKKLLKNEYHLLQDKEGWMLQTQDSSVQIIPGDTLNDTGQEVVIRKEVFPEEMDENILFFHNNRQCVSVRTDDEILFRLGEGERKYKFFTATYCAVPLPEKGEAYTIEITFHNLKTGVCEVPEFYFSSTNDILIYLCMKDAVALLSLPLWLLSGLALALFATILAGRKQKDNRISSLAGFIILVFVWSITDAFMVSLFQVEMEIVSTVNYYLLMFMPIPIALFIDRSSINRPLRLSKIIFTLLIGNVVLQTVLMLLNVTSLHQTLVLSQFFMIAIIFYGVIAMWLNYKANKTKIGKIQIASFTAPAIMGGVSVLAYWLKGMSSGIYHAAFYAAVMMFLIGMFLVIVFTQREQAKKHRERDAELKAYRTISIIDQLTGLKNRRAFDQQLDEVEDGKTGMSDVFLVFMDLNGLKYANDKFGHMAGDELLIAATKCIKKGFETKGSVYRIGGDEFAAVIIGTEAEISASYAKMDRSIEEYNVSAEIPLSIARGYCSIFKNDGCRRSISDWKAMADKNMYEDKVRNHTNENRGRSKDYFAIIASFVSAVDAKDSYTAEHSRRVELITEAICNMLGTSKVSTDEIVMAASLHDIGKIGIPDKILCKPGFLSLDEWSVMQTHAVIGEEIIKQNNDFYNVSKIIRHHHERVDGSGYPDGLTGSDIPLGSRIIAIADAIDAMVSGRSYNEAKTLDECRNEIESNLGTMYDKAIGKIVIEHWEEIEKIICASLSQFASANS